MTGIHLEYNTENYICTPNQTIFDGKNKSSKIINLELLKAFKLNGASINGRDEQRVEGEKGCRFGGEFGCLLYKHHFELSFP